MQMGSSFVKGFVPHEMKSLKLMILKNDRKGSFNELKSFMQIQDVKKLVDFPMLGMKFLSFFPRLKFNSNGRTHNVEKC